MRLDQMSWTVYIVIMTVLVVLAIADQPMLLVIIPVTLAGSYALVVTIMRLLGARSRPACESSIAHESEREHRS